MPGPTFNADAAVASGVAFTKEPRKVVDLQRVRVSKGSDTVELLCGRINDYVGMFSSSCRNWEFWKPDGRKWDFPSPYDLQNSPA